MLSFYKDYNKVIEGPVASQISRNNPLPSSKRDISPVNLQCMAPIS